MAEGRCAGIHLGEGLQQSPKCAQGKEMIIEQNIIQGSEQWFSAHAGVPGASSFNKIITTTGSPSKQADEYSLQLAGEYILGTMEHGYVSFAMQQGLDRESEARQYYEMVNDIEVEQVGMVFKDEKKDRLCSPDGLMHFKGLEIKCPMLKTHIKYLLDGKLPTEYFCQVQGSLYITGFDEWDFLSYYPGIKPFLITVGRNEAFITKLHEAMEQFLDKLYGLIRKLKEA
jgi:hypothetical protein